MSIAPGGPQFHGADGTGIDRAARAESCRPGDVEERADDDAADPRYWAAHVLQGAARFQLLSAVRVCGRSDPGLRPAAMYTCDSKCRR